MKFFAAFTAVLAVACAAPSTWTLNQLSEAIQSSNTSPALVPVLEQALNVYMQQMFDGTAQDAVTIMTSAGVTGSLTLAQVDAALSNSNISPIFKPYLEDALNQMMDALYAGHAMETIDVHIPALELSYWSLQQLDEALTSHTTNPALIPYLEDALNQIMSSLFAGGHESSVVVAYPATIVAESSPVVAEPVIVEPVATPVINEPAAPTSNSPLVQIILNVQQSNVIDVVAPAAIDATPIIERPTPAGMVQPGEVNPIDVIAPLPVQIVHTPAGGVGPMI